jgi:hypothetical protein
MFETLAIIAAISALGFFNELRARSMASAFLESLGRVNRSLEAVEEALERVMAISSRLEALEDRFDRLDNERSAGSSFNIKSREVRA